MAAEVKNGVAMDWIGAIAKESLTGAILCLVLFAFFRYLRRADEDFRVEMRQRLASCRVSCLPRKPSSCCMT
ncbi:MAG: hypothetical protein KatS3mg038_1885 [Candidatus Kapaibacterium sp.]|nr:MAG: hypothetical protein KatS3mg038_1885 [Candidatus Kapabacteria bacterium]